MCSEGQVRSGQVVRGREGSSASAAGCGWAHPPGSGGGEERITSGARAVALGALAGLGGTASDPGAAGSDSAGVCGSAPFLSLQAAQDNRVAGPAFPLPHSSRS